MREKYESLSLTVLKELAKARGMKGISAMKKSDLVEAMLAQDERTRHMRRSSGRESRRAESARNTADRKEKAQKGRFREEKARKTVYPEEKAKKTVHPEEKVRKAAHSEEKTRRAGSSVPTGLRQSFPSSTAALRHRVFSR